MSSTDGKVRCSRSMQPFHNPFVSLTRIRFLDDLVSGTWSIPDMPTAIRRLATRRRPSEVFGEPPVDARPPRGDVVGRRTRPVARSALGHERHRQQVEELATRPPLEPNDNEHICIRLHRPDKRGQYSAERVRMSSNSSSAASTPLSHDDLVDEEIGCRQTSPRRADGDDTLSEETAPVLILPSRDDGDSGSDVVPIVGRPAVSGKAWLTDGDKLSTWKNVFEQFASSYRALSPHSAETEHLAENDDDGMGGRRATFDAERAVSETSGTRERPDESASKDTTKKMKIIIMPTDTNIATSSSENSPPNDRLQIVETNPTTKRKRAKSSTVVRNRKRSRRLRYERSRLKLSRLGVDRICDVDAIDFERYKDVVQVPRSTEPRCKTTVDPPRPSAAAVEKSSEPRKVGRAMFRSAELYSQHDGAAMSTYGKNQKQKGGQPRRPECPAVVSVGRKSSLVSVTTDVLSKDVSLPEDGLSAGSSVCDETVSEDSSVEGLLLMTTKLNEAFSIRGHAEGRYIGWWAGLVGLVIIQSIAAKLYRAILDLRCA